MDKGAFPDEFEVQLRLIELLRIVGTEKSFAANSTMSMV